MESGGKLPLAFPGEIGYNKVTKMTKQLKTGGETHKRKGPFVHRLYMVYIFTSCKDCGKLNIQTSLTLREKLAELRSGSYNGTLY